MTWHENSTGVGSSMRACRMGPYGPIRRADGERRQRSHDSPPSIPLTLLNSSPFLYSQENVFYLVTSALLVLFAGCMSGLTLGLMSMDKVELEVLRRSGSAAEQRYASVRGPQLGCLVLGPVYAFDLPASPSANLPPQNIMPLISNAHYLLVTLLLCNAAASEDAGMGRGGA